MEAASDLPADGRSRGGFGGRLKALSWSGLENFSRQMLALVFFFVMVRYLAPSDVGVFSLAIAINSVLGIAIDEPTGEGLIQKETVSVEDWDTGFTVNLLIALACLLVSVLGSGLMAWLLHEPRLAYAVPVLSLASVVGAMGNIQRAYLSRALRFRTIAKAALLAQIVGGSAGIAMAAVGLGYWSQIGTLFVATALTTGLFWVVTPWKPRLRLSSATIRSRRAYFASYSLVRSVYQLRDQSPLLVVGLLGGVAEAGFLSLALRVVRSVGQLFEELTSRAALSLLSREQHELTGFGGVLLEFLAVVGLIAVPSFVGLAALGPKLVPLLFGPMWAAAGAMLPWVSGVVGGWLALHVVIVALRARGLGPAAFRTTMVATLLDLVVLATLAPISLDWALIGWAARSLLSLPFVILMLRARLGVAPNSLFRTYLMPALGTACMLLAIVALQQTTDLTRSVGGLLVVAAAGAVAYGLVMLGLLPRAGLGWPGLDFVGGSHGRSRRSSP
jgi:O-antigen/teichoic acid export membrane protein